jgi:hypothetical protein
MKWAIFLILFCFLPLGSTNAFEGGFVGGGGFSLYLSPLDVTPINESLESIGMPQFDGVMLFYGGQFFAHLNYNLRIGAVGFDGGMRVDDFTDGYAREAVFRLGWGGILVEYILYETGRFEFYGGGTLGWGRLSLSLEKSRNSVSWDDVWNSYLPEAGSEDNISSTFKHSFFLVQPRLGARYYLSSWLAVCGSVDFTVSHLSGDGWSLSGNEVYGAPTLDLNSPFFLLGVLFGG